MKLHRRVMWYCTDYILNKIIFWGSILLDTLMQIFIMLRYFVVEIWWSPSNPHRSEWPKTFLDGVYCVTAGSLWKDMSKKLYHSNAKYTKVSQVVVSFPMDMSSSSFWRCFTNFNFTCSGRFQFSPSLGSRILSDPRCFSPNQRWCNPDCNLNLFLQ